MIIPNLAGGLGNQMFQIATAYALSRKMGVDFAINYELPHTCIQGYTPKKYKDTLFRNIPTTTYVPKGNYSEPFFHFKDIECGDDTLLSGYFQSEKYFLEYGDDVKQLFYFDESDKEKWNKIVEKIPINSIIGCHVRRGDYTHYEHIHPCMSKMYYDLAIQYFERNNTIITGDIPTDNVVICSDDWYTLNSENIFTDYPYRKHYSTQGSTELQDLYTMAQCPKLVMSNSSFSWWAAFLGRSHNSVVAPKLWFGKQGPQDYQDIYNPFWFTI